VLLVVLVGFHRVGGSVGVRRGKRKRGVTAQGSIYVGVKLAVGCVWANQDWRNMPLKFLVGVAVTMIMMRVSEWPIIINKKVFPLFKK